MNFYRLRDSHFEVLKFRESIFVYSIPMLWGYGFTFHRGQGILHFKGLCFASNAVFVCLRPLIVAVKCRQPYTIVQLRLLGVINNLFSATCPHLYSYSSVISLLQPV